MTDTEFTDLDLNKDVSEMEPDEARETLVDFVEAHKKNRSAYDQLQSELDEVATEYEEKLEEHQEVIGEFKQERAEEAAEYANLPADLLVERFDFNELEQIIEEGTEYADEDETDEDEEEDSEFLTTFAEREEKGHAESGTSKYREAAESFMKDNGIPVGE